MKKFISFLFMAVLAGSLTSINAQKFTIGAKGGFSIPNLTGGGNDTPLSEGYASRLGIDYGIYGEYHFSRLFSVSLGAEYSSQGGQKDKLQAFPIPDSYSTMLPGYEYLYGDFKSVAKFNYLLLPVLARFTQELGHKSPFSVYAAVGPFVGILLNAHQETSGVSPVYMDAAGTPEQELIDSYDFANTQNIKSDLHPMNFGIEGFIGFAYKFAQKHSVFVEGGGNYGFIPIQIDDANGKNRTGAGTVTFGYAYTL